MALLDRLAEVLGDVLRVVERDEDGLTVALDRTVASLRVVPIAEGLELVSLTQPIGWDLPVTAELRERVAAQAGTTMLGTVTLVEKPAQNGPTDPPMVGDVMLRYNFPATGLEDGALRTLVLLVLATGNDVRSALTG